MNEWLNVEPAGEIPFTSIRFALWELNDWLEVRLKISPATGEKEREMFCN